MYVIRGHTVSRASDAYVMRLLRNRANAVAPVARSVGARIVSIEGRGERQPMASNAIEHGIARNCRVEILCVNYQGAEQ